MSNSRSREGAWIEISNPVPQTGEHYCRSREGAWIEIFITVSIYKYLSVAPARERGLK